MGVATGQQHPDGLSFARERLNEGLNRGRSLRFRAGFVRIRPVLMTAFAMIIRNGSPVRSGSGKAESRTLRWAGP